MWQYDAMSTSPASFDAPYVETGSYGPVLDGLDLTEIAVDAAARGVQDRADLGRGAPLRRPGW